MGAWKEISYLQIQRKCFIRAKPLIFWKEFFQPWAEVTQTPRRALSA